MKSTKEIACNQKIIAHNVPKQMEGNMIFLTISALILSPAIIVALAYSAMIYVEFFRAMKGVK